MLSADDARERADKKNNSKMTDSILHHILNHIQLKVVSISDNGGYEYNYDQIKEHFMGDIHGGLALLGEELIRLGYSVHIYEADNRIHISWRAQCEPEDVKS